MSPSIEDNRWSDALGALAELPREQRSAALPELCGNDPALEARLRQALTQLDEAESFFDRLPEPAAAVRAEAALSGPRRAGAYQIGEEVGRGGMGVVYRARRADGEFEREVAIKLMSLLVGSEENWRRFSAEKHILASLEHPNIARLLDAGITSDGAPFLTMEYVDGQPIHRYARERALGIRETLGLFLQICGAVAQAHQQLVIHRDLKPGNILVTDAGVVKLLDFGIAKTLSGSDVTGGITQTAGAAMTLQYASPEQVRGEPLSTATDIYSLGLILFELLCGRPAVDPDSASLVEWVDRICQREVALPSTAVAGDVRRAPVDRRPGQHRAQGDGQGAG